MVQGAEPKAKVGYRERHRAARRREFLDIARRIINTESQDALTMQRLSEETGSSAGGPYVYFASRDALIAELEIEAFQIILTSFQLGCDALDAFLADQGIAAHDAALTRVVANCAFWVDSETTLPGDIELSRRLIAGQTSVKADTGASVLPMALSLLDAGRQRLDGAVDAGVLVPGNSIERAVMLIASATGVLLVSKLGDWDQQLFDGRRLANALTADILVGWGASREELAVAQAHLDDFGRSGGSIAPPVAPPTA